MSLSSSFEPVSVVDTKAFSWVFIVDWILALILTIFVIFYFNRLVGTIISLVLRWVLWHKYQVRLKVQSIQLSLLGGRVFFKNLTYVGSNETITALQGNLTWRYWLHRRRLSKLESQINVDREGEGFREYNETLPTRLSLHVDGLEWLVYNRSAAYDDLFEYVSKHRSEESTSSSNADQNKEGESDSERTDVSPSEQSTSQPKSISQEWNSTSNSPKVDQNSQVNDFNWFESLYLKLFPFQVKCNRGSVVVGNRNVPNVLVLHFQSGKAVIDAAQCRNKLDRYKMLYNTRLSTPLLEMRPNIDYKDCKVNYGDVGKTHSKKTAKFMNRWTRVRRTILYLLNGFLAKDNTDDYLYDSDADAHFEWKGLSRYLSHEPQEDIELTDMDKGMEELEEEYGKYSTLLDAAEATIVYYYDIVGKVPENTVSEIHADSKDIGNGGSSPEWGFKLELKNSTISYGPWADRQRVPLQAMLLPRYCCNLRPQAKLLPNEDRIYTDLKFMVQFYGDTIFRIPTREFSKNAKFLAAYKEYPTLNSSRPFGWIEFKAKELSALVYTVSLITTKNGSTSTFRIDLKDLEVRSSVNHGLLFSAKSHSLHGKIRYPLQWNGLQTWQIRNTSVGVQTFFLREHVTLLTDLLKDFSSSPLTSYDLFTPYRYDITWDISGYAILLNVNDLNIINNPSDFEDNTYVSFRGQDLSISMGISMDQIFQSKNQLDFTIATPCFEVTVDTPQWHTIRNFLDSSKIGRALDFNLNGTYTYYSAISESKADTLVMEAYGSDATLICYGFFLQYLMKIRENYFGEYIHFRTLEEFSYNPEFIGPQFTHVRFDTDLDVTLCISVTNGTLLLPDHLYSAESNCCLNFSKLDIDVRFTNYYMDLQTNISPLRGKSYYGIESSEVLDIPKAFKEFDPEIYIDGLVIHGHRLFGLPPTEPTYFCKWDFDMGDVLINGSLDLVASFGRIVDCLAFSFEDAENSLLLTVPPLYDVTFLSVKISTAQFQFHAEDTTLELVTGELDIRLNDLANDRYSGRITVQIPVAEVSILGPSGDNVQSVEVLAAFKTSVLITNFFQKRDFEARRRRQQGHIALHDGPFGRCPFLLDKEHRILNESEGKHNLFASIPLPIVQPPLTNETLRLIDLNAREDIVADSSTISSSISSRSRFALSSEGSSSASSVSPSRLPSYSPNSSNIDDRKSLFCMENDYVPRKVWASFRKVSPQFRTAKLEFDLHPTCYYSNEEPIAPKGIIDQSVEYDNFIIQLGPLEGSMGPNALGAANSLIQSTQRYSIADTMDSLQMDIAKRIRYIVYGNSEVKNFRLVLPSIDVKYGKLHSRNDEDIPSIEDQQSYLYFNSKGINLALRTAVLKKPETVGEYMRRAEEVPLRNTIYLEVEYVSIGVRRHQNDSPAIQQDYAPAMLQVDHSEVWWHEDDENVGMLRIKSVDSILMSKDIAWIACFLDENMRDIKNLGNKQAVSIRSGQNRSAFVVHQLALAGDKFRIEHDPPALTKPAYIIRSPQHIRANTSWKIVMRLRHLYKSLPSSFLTSLEQLVRSNNFKLSPEAKYETVNTFLHWRSWELPDIPESYFFQHVYVERSIAESILSCPSNLFIDMESIGLRLQYQEEEDFLCFDFLKVLLNWNSEKGTNRDSLNNGRESLAMIDVDSTVACSNIRSRISEKLVGVVDDVAEIVQNSVAHSKAADSSLSTVPTGNKSMNLLLNLCCTVLVKMTGMMIATPNLECSIEGKELKFNTFLKQNNRAADDLTLSVVSQAQRFYLTLIDRDGHDRARLVTSSVDVLEASLISKGPILTCQKHILVKVSNVLNSVEQDIPTLTQTALKVVKVEYKLIGKYLEPKSSEQGQVEARSRISLRDLNLKLELKSVQIKLSLLSQLYVVCEVNSSRLNFSLPDHDQFWFSLEVLSQGMRLIEESSTGDKELLNFGWQNTQLISRTGLTSMPVFEFALDVDDQEIEVSSVYMFLKYMAKDSVWSEISSIMECSKELANALEPEHQTEKIEDSGSREFSVNASVNVKASAILLSFEESELLFTTHMFNSRVTSLGEVEREPAMGLLSVSSLDIAVRSPSIGADISKLLSVAGAATFQERESKEGKDSIQIRSDFTKLLLCPRTLEELFKMVTRVENSLKQVERSRRSSMIAKNDLESDSESASFASVQKIKEFADRSVTVISFNGFSVAWLFNGPEAFVPGILLGYESFEINTTSFVARTTLSGVYITPAIKDEIFLPHECTERIPNSAILPYIELVLRYDLQLPHSMLSLGLRGESLKLICLPSAVSIVAATAESFAITGKAMERYAISKDSVASDDSTQEKIMSADKPLRFPISFHLDLQFEAAVISIWDTMEFYEMLHNGESDQTPALYLKTPSFKGEASYTLVDGKKPDEFSTDVLISSFSNTVYPVAVPVLLEMGKIAKEVMRSRHFERENKLSKDNSYRRFSRSLSTSLASSGPADTFELGNVNINVGIKMLRQEFTLSCFPTAKVAATVAHDQMYVGINTCYSEENGRFYTGTVRINKLRSSLQHIYSREVTGYISIDDVLLFGVRSKDLIDGQNPGSVLASLKVSDIAMNINMRQMQNLELFLDIYQTASTNNSVPSTPVARPVSSELSSYFDNTEAGIVSKYHEATTTLAIPWSVSVTVVKVVAVADLGQSIGKLTLGIDRFWLSSRKSTSWEQSMLLGFDEVNLESEGRLGGSVSMKRLQARTAIMWKEALEDSVDFRVPLVQVLVGLDAFEAKASLDYRIFSCVSVRKLNMTMSNQQDDDRILEDRLLVVADCDSINFYFTALAASNILEIYYTFVRMREESNASYDAILQESSHNNEPPVEEEEDKVDAMISRIISKLHTVLDIRINSFGFHVFPNSFSDQNVFMITLDGAVVRYIQEQKNNAMESDLQMKLSEFSISLATVRKPLSEDVMTHLEVPKFVSFVSEFAKGGTIISVPVTEVTMFTTQEIGSCIVEYKFESSFGGRVDVGWNLGSVNFIRGLWETHVQAFETRREAYAMRASTMLSSRNIDDKIRDVKLDSAYTYIPLEPPNIATPQLRDMGEATPPIEWIGLHRQRFPGMTHQAIIITLQSLVHDSELLYLQVLGHS